MSLGNFANVVSPFEFIKHNLPSLANIQHSVLSQNDTIETQRNIRTVKKLYGVENLFKKEKMLPIEEVELGGVAGMTKTIEPTRVVGILKDNRDLF